MLNIVSCDYALHNFTIVTLAVWACRAFHNNYYHAQSIIKYNLYVEFKVHSHEEKKNREKKNPMHKQLSKQFTVKLIYFLLLTSSYFI